MAQEFSKKSNEFAFLNKIENEVDVKKLDCLEDCLATNDLIFLIYL
jgi:hypothetical protein